MSDEMKIGGVSLTDTSLIRNQSITSQAEKLTNGKLSNLPNKEAEKASEDFEALLLQQMFASMWKTTGIFGEKAGREEELFRDMLNEAVAKDVSKSKSIGIKDEVFQELSKREAKKS